MHSSPLPDLVKDSQLQAAFRGDTTVHRTTSTDSHGRRVKHQEQWKIEEYLGQGAYGRVWKESRVSNENDEEAVAKVRAVKMILKPQHASKGFDYNRELEAIAKFSHQRYESRFVKSFGWYESRQAIFIAMEFMVFGDLQKYMPGPGESFPSHDTQDMISQMLEGLSYMHENGFAHRDLKPANILIKSKPPENEKWWVKIGDFGISKRATDEHDPSTIKGTFGFMSPELLLTMNSSGTRAKGSFAAQPTDMWALGEITLRMIIGAPSFKDVLAMLRWIESPNLEFLDPLKSIATDDAFDFVQKLLRAEPTKRLSAKQAMRHPWIDPNGEASDSDSDSLSLPETAEQHWPQYPQVDDTFKTDEPSAKWSELVGSTTTSQRSWQEATLRPETRSGARLSTESVESTLKPRTPELPMPPVGNVSPAPEVSAPASTSPADNRGVNNEQDVPLSLPENPTHKGFSTDGYEGYQDGDGGFLLGRKEMPLGNLGGPEFCSNCNTKLLWTDLFALKCDKCDFPLDRSAIPPSLLKVHEDYEARMAPLQQHRRDAPLDDIEEEWSEQGNSDSEQSDTNPAKPKTDIDQDTDSDAGSVYSMPVRRRNQNSNSKRTDPDQDDTHSNSSLEEVRYRPSASSKSKTKKEPIYQYGEEGPAHRRAETTDSSDVRRTSAKPTQRKDGSYDIRWTSAKPRYNDKPSPIGRFSTYTKPPTLKRSETMPDRDARRTSAKSTQNDNGPPPIGRSRTYTKPPTLKRSETMPYRDSRESSARPTQDDNNPPNMSRYYDEPETEKERLAREAGIPSGYALRNWDPEEEPIRMLGSIFDMQSIGKWMFDWTIYHQGPAHPYTTIASELWILLIRLAGKSMISEKFMSRVDRMKQHESTQPIPEEEDLEMVEDFLESAERLLVKFQKLLNICEGNMLQTAKHQKGDTKPFSPSVAKDIGKELILTIFGREEKLEMTEKWMSSVRLWSMRWDAVCLEIIHSVKGTAIVDREAKMNQQEQVAEQYIHKSTDPVKGLANARVRENEAMAYIARSKLAPTTRAEPNRSSGHRADSSKKKKKPGFFSRAFGAAS